MNFASSASKRLVCSHLQALVKDTAGNDRSHVLAAVASCGSECGEGSIGIHEHPACICIDTNNDVITNLATAIPLVGSDLLTALWGGEVLNAHSLGRFYCVHFLVPLAL